MNQDIKQVTNQEIIAELKRLSEQEKLLVNRSIDLLREVEERRIYLKMGYPSLYEFCITELHYSEGASYRRIAAMRLIKAVPEIKEKAEAGKISLTAMAQAQSYFKRKENELTPINKTAKLELLSKLEHRSSRECEREILKLDPKSHRPDRVVAKTEHLTEIRLTVDNDFMAALDKLKDLLSNKHPELSTKDIMLHAMKAEVARLQKPIARRRIHAVKKAVAPAGEASAIAPVSAIAAASDINPKSATLTIANQPAIITVNSNPITADPRSAKSPAARQKGRRIHLPDSTRREVFIKDNWECAYKDPMTGHKCSSKKYLEIDHIKPISRGGKNETENLQLLCSAHNKLKSNYMPINFVSAEFNRKPTGPPTP